MRSKDTVWTLLAIFALIALEEQSDPIIKDAHAQASQLKPCPKSTSKLWTNCFGTVSWNAGQKTADGTVLEVGGRYTGEWLNDQFNGNGTLVLDSGETFVGRFKNGEFVSATSSEELVKYVPTPNNQYGLPEIYINGEISESLYNTLLKVVESNGIQDAKVQINSDGGSLYYGMAIGRYLRQKGFSTEVGSYNGAWGNSTAGGCHSACNFVFMGGVWRYFDTASRYGAHRFYGGAEGSKSTTAVEQETQAVVGELLKYVQDMGVSPEYLLKMAEQDSADLEMLDIAELRRFNIVNDGKDAPYWSVVLDPKRGYSTEGVQRSAEQSSTVRLRCVAGGPRIEFDELNQVYASSPPKKLIMQVGVSSGGRERFFPVPSPAGPLKIVDDVFSVAVPSSREINLAILGGDRVGLTYSADDTTRFSLWIDYNDEYSRAFVSNFFSFCGVESRAGPR